MFIRISVLAFILFVSFVSSEESSSVIEIRNQSTDAYITGHAFWEPESKTESSVVSTGKIPPGQKAILKIPKKKFLLTLNNFKFDDIIEPIGTEQLDGPINKCYEVTGSRDKITMKPSCDWKLYFKLVRMLGKTTAKSTGNFRFI